MKPKSISALVYKVVDMEKTIKWYEGLGFTVAKNEDGRLVTIYVNWFSIELHLVNETDNKPKAGPLVLVSVELDPFYEAAMEAGYVAEYGPEKTVNGRTEFALRDPNGYLMVFFEKK
jgi:catechol 2,3-dioxygenase-like lactoylglutathione lyase family enzyme